MRILKCSMKSHLAVTHMVLTLVFFLASISDSAKVLPPDACSLLTPTQLEKILGQPFELSDRTLAPATAQGQPAGRECDYTAQKGGSRKVVLIAFVDGSAAQAREIYDKLSLWLSPKSKVAGTWDVAYMDDNHAIHVLKGKVRYYINIVPFGSANSEKEKKLKDLAGCVAEQI
jgi:hypothetical protein